MASLKRCDKCGKVLPADEIKSMYPRTVNFDAFSNTPRTSRAKYFVRVNLEVVNPSGAQPPDICHDCMQELYGLGTPASGVEE